MKEPRKVTERQVAYLRSLSEQLGGDWDDRDFRSQFWTPDYASQAFTVRDASIVIDMMKASIARREEG